MDDDQRPMMEEEAKQNHPTEDNRDPGVDKDDRLFHPENTPHLAEDGAPPASPAHDVPGPKVPLDYPQTDSNVDQAEAYDVGIGNASGVNNSHEDSTTVEPVVDEDENASGRFQ